MKKMMLGNEAFAYGAYLAGARVGAAYPGTPSTEIMEAYATYPGVHAEWAPNEKVALDVGIGAAYAGTRALVSLKQVGLNVAADALFYSSYTGLKAGLVLVVADDPSMHSSSTEQDSRSYAKAAKVPMLEPADSEEAKLFTGIALDLSEKFDTPVLVRSVTRISHSATPVEISDVPPPPAPSEPPMYDRQPLKFVMVPANARTRHPIVVERLEQVKEFAETFPHNRIEMGDESLGIVTSGTSYQYAREIFPNASFLKLGMVWPLPEKMIREFASRVKTLIVVEELVPVFEEYIRWLGLPVRGRDIFPEIGEFSPHLVKECALAAGLIEEEDKAKAEAAATTAATPQLPNRPPMLCAGCGHRALFHVIRESGALVLGDIGCYTLSFAPPLNAIHTTGCMGAGIGQAHGVAKGGVKDRIIAVLGDSTFMHSGIHPLINVLYNESNVTTIISDNRVTAMTGSQQHPGTGITLQGKHTTEVKPEELVRGMGFKKIDILDPHDIDNLAKVLEDHLNSNQPSVIIARRPCVILTKERHTPPIVDKELCVDCGSCMEIGCTPLIQEDGYVRIDPILCNGCNLCIKICPAEAIIDQQKE